MWRRQFNIEVLIGGSFSAKTRDDTELIPPGRAYFNGGNMEIKIIEAAPHERKPRPDQGKLGFGKYFSDHMFTMKYKEG